MFFGDRELPSRYSVRRTYRVVQDAPYRKPMSSISCVFFVSAKRCAAADYIAIAGSHMYTTSRDPRSREHARLSAARLVVRLSRSPQHHDVISLFRELSRLQLTSPECCCRAVLQAPVAFFFSDSHAHEPSGASRKHARAAMCGTGPVA